MRLPERTGATTLSDDELLLFDCMFDGRVERRLLERDHYSFQWNVPYCHQLDSDRLTDGADALGCARSGRRHDRGWRHALDFDLCGW